MNQRRNVMSVAGSVCFGLLLISGMLPVGHADAATKGMWDRNTEGDMDHYNVYACFYVAPATSCTVVQNNAMKQPGSIAQTPVGSVPFWSLPVGKNGVWAVSATDTSFNESGMSVSVPFDTIPPVNPTGAQNQ